MEIGFLGLGIKGKVMSMHLLKNGFKVTIRNRTLSKYKELVEFGLIPKHFPRSARQLHQSGNAFFKALELGSKRLAKIGRLVILAIEDKELYE
ncbi:unnamed protein product [Dovyalis caffra]|uniref:6-phosphogluconate dehydrogenase NADP-binding domain-containing protein n=1 Tax=Dovyalis caffra TaxID=77055 RepID=A0AAV1R043_9ROSI|nr:unnamed protein product [Dovyalis caffra]